jgi:hypothetical protein
VKPRGADADDDGGGVVVDDAATSAITEATTKFAGDNDAANDADV